MPCSFPYPYDVVTPVPGSPPPDLSAYFADLEVTVVDQDNGPFPSESHSVKLCFKLPYGDYAPTPNAMLALRQAFNQVEQQAHDSCTKYCDTSGNMSLTECDYDYRMVDPNRVTPPDVTCATGTFPFGHDCYMHGCMVIECNIQEDKPSRGCDDDNPSTGDFCDAEGMCRHS
jgi:hypothetical protein